MLLTLTVASTEVEDFVAELQLEGHSTFAELHRLMHRAFGWQPSQPTMFYICDHRWRPERVVPEVSEEHDTMSEVELGDLLEDEGQRMQYMFNPEERRGLLIEVSGVSFGKHLDEPRVRRQHGTPPPYSISEEEEEEPQATMSNADLLAQLNAQALGLDDNEEDYDPEDTDDFDSNELDMEGYEVSEY